MSRKGLRWLVLTCGLLLCGLVVEVAAQTARVGREFRVKAGRGVTLDGGRLRVRFVEVESDSRCPADVDCIWAGNAQVRFEVGGRGGRGKKSLTLNTSGSPQLPNEARYGRYTLKLVGLAPQTRSDDKIAPDQYTATLLVSKE